MEMIYNGEASSPQSSHTSNVGIAGQRGQVPDDDTGNASSSSAERRLTCDRCLRMKKKCDKSKPQCLACQKRGQPCFYTVKQKPGRKRLNPSSQAIDNNNPPPPRRQRVDRELLPTAAPTLPPITNVADSEQLEENALGPSQQPPFSLSAYLAAPELQTALPSTNEVHEENGDFGAQETLLLGFFHKIFRHQVPALDPAHDRQLIEKKSRQDSTWTSVDELAIFSAVATGAVLCGARRGLPRYLARVRAAADAGALGAAADAHRAGLRALLRLALMGDSLGQSELALALLDRCGPAAAALGDHAVTASVKMLKLTMVASSEHSVQYLVAMVREGREKFFEAEEEACVQWPCRVYYNSAFILMKQPFGFGDDAASKTHMEAAVQAVHRSLILAADGIAASQAGEFGPLTVFITHDLLFLVEITCLGEIYRALDRGRRMIIPVLQAHPGLIALSTVAMRVHAITYAFWLARDESTYAALAALWNEQVALLRGHNNPRPLPPFREYNANVQCEHYRCKMLTIPKIKLAMDSFLLGTQQA